MKKLAQTQLKMREKGIKKYTELCSLASLTIMPYANAPFALPATNYLPFLWD